jgi:hypothetical protein
VLCSFQKGEVFFVHNDMGDGWLWVTSQSTNHSGIINQELVKEVRDAAVDLCWGWLELRVVILYSCVRVCVCVCVCV